MDDTRKAKKEAITKILIQLIDDVADEIVYKLEHGHSSGNSILVATYPEKILDAIEEKEIEEAERAHEASLETTQGNQRYS